MSRRLGWSRWVRGPRQSRDAEHPAALAVAEAPAALCKAVTVGIGCAPVISTGHPCGGPAPEAFRPSDCVQSQISRACTKIFAEIRDGADSRRLVALERLAPGGQKLHSGFTTLERLVVGAPQKALTR